MVVTDLSHSMGEMFLSSYRILLLLFLLPLAPQPFVGFGLSNNILPFFFFRSPISHLLAVSSWKSLSTSCFHPFLGLPLRLVPSSSWVKIFLGILSSSILSSWPNQLILCPLYRIHHSTKLLYPALSTYVSTWPYHYNFKNNFIPLCRWKIFNSHAVTVDRWQDTFLSPVSNTINPAPRSNVSA